MYTCTGTNELKQNCAWNFTINIVLHIFTSHGWRSVVFLYSPWIVTPGLWRWVLQFVLSVWIRKLICFRLLWISVCWKKYFKIFLKLRQMKRSKSSWLDQGQGQEVKPTRNSCSSPTPSRTLRAPPSFNLHLSPTDM